MAKISLPLPKKQTNQVFRGRRFKERLNEHLEVTSAPKEKSKSPKDLCFTEEATELSIVWENTQGVINFVS